MAFRTIFEKGNLLIEKTYRRDELEKDFKVRDFSLDLKESRKEYKELRTEAARRNLKNQAVSAAEGLGLGLLGVGLPDIAIFTAMLLRGVYETALYFGFPMIRRRNGFLSYVSWRLLSAGESSGPRITPGWTG